MAALKTVAEGWDGFLEDVVKPNNPGMTDYSQFRAAFYAGAMVFMVVAAEASPKDIETLCFELHSTIGVIAGAYKDSFDA
jgi:hypothetical protein